MDSEKPGSNSNKPNEAYDRWQVLEDSPKERIKAEYAKEGRLEEYEIFHQLQDLERQKLDLEQKLIIARQNRERQDRIAKSEEKLKQGGELSLLDKIDRELEAELNKAQEDYDNE